MRLLDTVSFELKEFNDNKIPKYAILSHTWEKEEVSFQDMQSGNAKPKIGYSKIVGACRMAGSRELRYIWIDTCCIDKTSSAELTEAINSMYRWYQNAQVCFAYLSDVHAAEDILSKGSSFSKSRWFTRGWTLQELIAPSVVVFYSNDWQYIGTKIFGKIDDLSRKISAVTRVDAEVLGGRDPQSISIAKRMSWASRRITTRKEDIAYCLMGLFGVNMPLLYGEGERAFIRLQEEIMKVSDDHSLFAWRDAVDLTRSDPLLNRSQPKRRRMSSEELSFQGLLARSPAYFAHSNNIIPFPSDHISTPYSTTNRGLRIELVLLPGLGDDIYSGVLNCWDVTQPCGPLGIHLKCLSPPNGDQFARVFSDELQHISRTRGEGTLDILPTRTLYVKENPQVTQSQHSDIDIAYLFSIPKLQPSTGYYNSAVHPPSRWSPLDGILSLPSKSFGVAGVLLFESVSKGELAKRMPFMVVVAVNCNFCVSIRIEAGKDLKKVYERNEFLLEDDSKRRPKLGGPHSYTLQAHRVVGGYSEGPKKMPEVGSTHSYTPRVHLDLGGYWAGAWVESAQTEVQTKIGPRNVFTVHVNTGVYTTNPRGGI
jgi:Heterokaryon incompatibility protein (HET)